MCMHQNTDESYDSNSFFFLRKRLLWYGIDEDDLVSQLQDANIRSTIWKSVTTPPYRRSLHFDFKREWSALEFINRMKNTDLSREFMTALQEVNLPLKESNASQPLY